MNLAATGDSIKVTWAFTLTNINPGQVNNSNTSQGLHIGLVDQLINADSTTPRLTANGSPPSTQWRGYGLWANMGQTLGNSNPFQLRKRTLGGSSGVGVGNLLNTTSDFGTVLGNGATSGNHGYDAATPYTLTWEITRNASSGLDIVTTMSGGTLNGTGTATVSVTDATPVGVDSGTTPFGSYKFDTFAIRPSSAALSAEMFNTSLFKVEFTTLTAPPILAGDYNNNGVVDAADYVTWRKNEGPNAALPNDNGEVTQAGRYTLWRANFGKTPGSGSSLTAVPEPTTILFALIGVLGTMGLRRRGKVVA